MSCGPMLGLLLWGGGWGVGVVVVVVGGVFFICVCAGDALIVLERYPLSE